MKFFIKLDKKNFEKKSKFFSCIHLGLKPIRPQSLAAQQLTQIQ